MHASGVESKNLVQEQSNAGLNLYVCLAAGRGQRMRPLTNYLHKAMIPFSGLPFLAYSVLSTPRDSQIIIVVNYLAEQIINYFGTSYQGRNIKYLKQTDPKGTGDALFQFSELYEPKLPVTAWLADQMISADDFEIISQAEPNAMLGFVEENEFSDIGVWKIKPATLKKLKGCFENGEYRALPVLRAEGINLIKSKRRKIEISFAEWSNIESKCKTYRQKFPTEFPWLADSRIFPNSTGDTVEGRFPAPLTNT